MELSFWAATDVGKKREINEDNFLVDKKLSLFVVADGMGGHASGEVASKLAVHEFRNAVEAGRDAIDKFSKGDATVRPQDLLQLLENAVQAAGQAVYHKGVAEPEKRGMGTTASALLISGDRGFIAHVGDSRNLHAARRPDGRRFDPSRTRRSRSSRASPTRQSSRSKTCACSRSSRPETVS